MSKGYNLQHPDLLGHTSDAIRDAALAHLKKPISFDVSELMAKDILEAQKHWNSAYTAAKAAETAKERERIFSLMDRAGDFVVGDDGFVVFWPQGALQGAMNPWMLRMIADEIDRRNEAWQAQVDEVAAKMFGDGTGSAGGKDSGQG